MATSQIVTNSIADFLEWHSKGQLVLNPEFQRRRVWSPAAKVFLIDTILRELSIPKIYIRTRIDLATRKSIREVVDGQQRLGAIIDFSNDKIKLTKRTGEFEGYTYSTLPQDLQETFLKYQLSVEELVNASDGDVLEVFSRLNSYGERLNSAELRHAEFQGAFKWLVRDTSKQLDWLWEKYSIIGTRQRLRMEDDALVAELYGILLEGLGDGGARVLNRLYKIYDAEVPQKEALSSRFNEVINVMTSKFDDALQGPLSRRPSFLVFFAAVAHSIHALPSNRFIDMPPTRPLKDSDTALDALARLSDALESEEVAVSPDLREFRAASSTTTQRIKSREVRFRSIYGAITE